jgi:hypothetical protein
MACSSKICFEEHGRCQSFDSALCGEKGLKPVNPPGFGGVFSSRRERPKFPRAGHRSLQPEWLSNLGFYRCQSNPTSEKFASRRSEGSNCRSSTVVFNLHSLGEPDKSSLQRAIGSMGIFMCPRACFPIFALRRSSVGSKISCLVRFGCYRRFVGIGFRDWSAGVIEFFERFRRGRDLEDRIGMECGSRLGVFSL